MYFTIEIQRRNSRTRYYWKMWKSRQKHELIATSEKLFRTRLLCKEEIDWIIENAADADIGP